MGLYDHQIEFRVKGYACVQKQVKASGEKASVKVPVEWIDRNVIVILAGTDLQRIP